MRFAQPPTSAASANGSCARSADGKSAPPLWAALRGLLGLVLTPVFCALVLAASVLRVALFPVAVVLLVLAEVARVCCCHLCYQLWCDSAHEGRRKCAELQLCDTLRGMSGVWFDGVEREWAAAWGAMRRPWVAGWVCLSIPGACCECCVALGECCDTCNDVRRKRLAYMFPFLPFGS